MLQCKPGVSIVTPTHITHPVLGKHKNMLSAHAQLLTQESVDALVGSVNSMMAVDGSLQKGEGSDTLATVMRSFWSRPGEVNSSVYPSSNVRTCNALPPHAHSTPYSTVISQCVLFRQRDG